MTVNEFLSIAQQVKDSQVKGEAQVKIKLLDGSRIDLAAMPFTVEGNDESFSVDNSGHWAPSVVEADCVVLNQI